MGENPGAGGGMDQYLEAVRQQISMPPGPAVFDVIMNRMIVTGGHLESGEVRIGERSRRYIKFFSDIEIFEVFRLGEFVFLWGKVITH